jgi:hypothetical protein
MNETFQISVRKHICNKTLDIFWNPTNFLEYHNCLEALKMSYNLSNVLELLKKLEPYACFGKK